MDTTGMIGATIGKAAGVMRFKVGIRVERISCRWWIALELAFETKALRDVCESEKEAKEQLGVVVASQLKRRLADLQAAKTIDELPVARPKKNSNNCVIALSKDCRLVATAGHTENPTLPSGKIDWTNVTRLRLIVTAQVGLRHGLRGWRWQARDCWARRFL